MGRWKSLGNDGLYDPDTTIARVVRVCGAKHSHTYLYTNLYTSTHTHTYTRTYTYKLSTGRIGNGIRVVNIKFPGPFKRITRLRGELTMTKASYIALVRYIIYAYKTGTRIVYDEISCFSYDVLFRFVWCYFFPE